MYKFALVILISCCCMAQPAQAEPVILRGAGATFPAPLYQLWFDEFYSLRGTRVEYDEVGSGTGIQRLLGREVDFGATDSFLSDAELQAQEPIILHMPTCLGAVALVYNLPGNPKLRLTPELVADIFLGRITKWSDRRITQVNPGATMPDVKIAVVHRSDVSGTTSVFTGYLAEVSEEWKTKVGQGRTVEWPRGMGVDGNPGVVNFIQRIPGSVGYAELTHATQKGLAMASLRNRSGRFIYPDAKSVSAAADVELPDDTRISILNTASPDGYAISAFTYLIVFKEQGYNQRTKDRARELSDLFWWMIHEGQAHCSSKLYAPLPERAVKKAEAVVHSLLFNGEPLL